MEYVCHSGGCPGSDMMWENEGYQYGIKTVAYSFHNHSHKSKNPKVLTFDELKEGYEAAKIADKALKRGFDRIFYPYVKNLLGRNWFQVKNSDAVFAIGTFLNSKHKIVNGGTGWAVQMAVDNKKEVFFFDQDANCWNKYNYDLGQFEVIDYIPKLTQNFAGIGTREISVDGENAIREILKYNMGLGTA